MRAALALVVAACTAVAVGTAAAQTVGSVALLGGSSTDARGFRSNSVTLAPMARIAGGRTSIWTLGAAGTRYAIGAWSAGVNAGVHTRTSIGGPLVVALDAAGSMSGTSYDATFAAGEVVPTAEVSWRALSIFGGARAAVGHTSLADLDAGGLLGRLRPVDAVTRTSLAPVFGASLRAGGWPRPVEARVWSRVDPVRTSDVSAHDETIGLAVAAGPVTVAASGGRRRSADRAVVDDFGMVSAVVSLSRAFALHAAGGMYAADVLTGASSGRFFSAGVRVTFGGTHGALPRPDGITAPLAGVTRLSIRAPSARRVELRGDWNGWQAQRAERAANGVWYVDLRLDPGEYRYAFRIDGGEWRVPQGAAGVDDGFGGKSAYVVVPERGRTQQVK